MWRVEMKMSLYYTVVIIALCVLIQCASAPVSNGVLEEVKDQPATASMSSAPNNPSLQRLLDLLQSMGYEGLGLQFEGNDVLELIYRVFSSPKAHNRQLRLVYTGLILTYEPKHRSLTIGGTRDVATIIAYIEKNIPLRPPGERAPLPPPVWLTPTPEAVPPPQFPVVRPAPSTSPQPLFSPHPAPVPLTVPSNFPNLPSTPVPVVPPPPVEFAPPASPAPVPTVAPSSPDAVTKPQEPPPLFDTPAANPSDSEI